MEEAAIEWSIEWASIPNEATRLVNLPHALLKSFRTSISCLSGALGVVHNYTVLQIIQK